MEISEIIHGTCVSSFYSFPKAEVDADSLQMLHAAHNLLEVLDHAKERQLPARQISPVQVRT